MKSSFLRVFFVVMGSLFVITAVSAHGGGEIKIANAPIGPYKLTLWLNPPSPQATKTTHITVGLAAPPDDAPMLDATINIDVIDAVTNNLVLTTPATTAASTNKLFYETDFTLPDSGIYEVKARVTAPDAQGDASFTMEVTPTNQTNWLLIGIAGLGLVILFTLLRNQRRN